MNKLLLVPTLLLILHPVLLLPAEPPISPAGAGDQLVCRYRIAPKGEPKEKGSAEVVIATAGDYIDYAARITLAEMREEIRIRTTPPGKVVSAQRRTFSGEHHLFREEILVTGSKVSVTREEGERRKLSQIDLPRNRELAVDGSLLLLVQSFPFDQGKTWELFMVDFSAFSTQVSVRQTGRERVTVPAGEFDCYRMELVLNIPILKPKITYWISTSEPHVVVKHQGKRGPFTGTYITSLISVEKRVANPPKESRGPVPDGRTTEQTGRIPPPG